uniref:Uncharacterized protein n=1 Tax=Meloidogyne enterolobii TaxID=390850 RepID=A0A6V7TUW7_MELEN|nr:unnamed protein product [Meloidogyne enterolobii]
MLVMLDDIIDIINNNKRKKQSKTTTTLQIIVQAFLSTVCLLLAIPAVQLRQKRLPIITQKLTDIQIFLQNYANLERILTTIIIMIVWNENVGYKNYLFRKRSDFFDDKN